MGLYDGVNDMTGGFLSQLGQWGQQLPQQFAQWQQEAAPPPPPDQSQGKSSIGAYLREAMARQGINDPMMRAGIGAIVGGESAFEPRSEMSYSTSPNPYLRTLFGNRLGNVNDQQLSQMKGNDEAFFNQIYGGPFGRQYLGNTDEGDGYRYRGRGLFQLTGRKNYEQMGQMLGMPELVDNPDLANHPKVAAEIAAAYMKQNYQGGGWASMKRAVGNSMGIPDQTKDQLFNQYLRSGEFAPQPQPQGVWGYGAP